jgi:hypothetical protein
MSTSRKPSRRRKPQRKAQVNWERVGRVALVLVLFAVLASYLRPVTGLVGSWQDSKASEERLAQLQREHAQLQRESAADSTDAVIVREARRLGFVRTGERPFVVDRLPSE